MDGSRTATLALALLVIGSTALVLGSPSAAAQLREPPMGWDMWDPGWIRRDTWKPDRMDQGLRWRMTRHWSFMQEGVPETYRDARNPLASTPSTLGEGRALYLDNCASCHDPLGTGHGDAGLALYPSPALLADFIRMPEAVDPYLMWAVSEGGKSFGTGMPAFKDRLNESQIWQIITYMRAGFPSNPGADDGSTGPRDADSRGR